MGPHWVVWTWPLVGGVIGWFTNAVAIRMIFHPRRAVRIPLVGWTFQGLLPRRRADLARSLGEVVQDRLMPVDGVIQQLDLAALKGDMQQTLAAHVRQRFDDQWPRFLPNGLRQAVEPYLTDWVLREASLLFDRLSAETEAKLREKLQLGRVVEEQVLNLNLVELEALVQKLAHRELRHIEWLGALLGFLIGLVQSVLWWVSRGLQPA